MFQSIEEIKNAHKQRNQRARVPAKKEVPAISFATDRAGYRNGKRAYINRFNVNYALLARAKMKLGDRVSVLFNANENTVLLTLAEDMGERGIAITNASESQGSIKFTYQDGFPSTLERVFAESIETSEEGIMFKLPGDRISWETNLREDSEVFTLAVQEAG